MVRVMWRSAPGRPRPHPAEREAPGREPGRQLRPAERAAKRASVAATSRHVAVIGSGVVGLSCAQALLERGCRVTVIERGGPERDSCSLGNAGYISPSHIFPLASP